ncbi:MAG: GAF domain-containing protein [Candidatus Dadabacteria bacterium]|nr:GAF domain-containing protein [Candidatus Dadabacteria bacterium]NIS08703.1 GAF domain-containing protein [Candidatus Dadabacteria bacterium]NIV42185.1 GAF domain-containing protein [Candidatus Dadabacteria bacterium]NIX15389.1 GAF domain-containing protein [Candidatus Dadabacteria bacterium]NIY22052.1 GAF domain-containing protein [Candidatus Dadabacteria bacterium]
MFLLDPADGNLYFRATTAISSNLLSDVPVPLDESIAGHIHNTGKPLIVDDVQSNPHFYKGIDKLLGFKSKSLMGVPLKIKEKSIGVLEAVNKKTRNNLHRKMLIRSWFWLLMLPLQLKMLVYMSL